MKPAPVLAAAALAAIMSLARGPIAHGQTVGDITPLGEGAQSGAVCEAIRDYDDPVAQRPGGKAWVVRCNGWDAPIGRLYLSQDRQALAAWRTRVGPDLDCQAAASETIAGVTGVERTACRLKSGGTPYLLYAAQRGSVGLGAQGYAATADVLEAGLEIVSGAARAPTALGVQRSPAMAEIAAEFGGSIGGLADAERAAATNATGLISLGYVQNNEWRFGSAQDEFLAVADQARSRNSPAAEQAEALLNLALNISDQGRFADADAVFAEADREVAAANDAGLRAEAFNYRALHLRNQGRFADAVAAAEQGLAVRAELLASQKSGLSGAAPGAPGAVVIDADLAGDLNSATLSDPVMGTQAPSPAKRLMIQDVEALEVIGSSKSAQGDLAGGAEAINRGLAMLTAAEARQVLSVQLRARLLADLGDLDLAAGRPAEAVGHYGSGLHVLRTRHAGSEAEAGLLLDLGRAQIAAGAEKDALASYGRAFDIFKAGPGSLGDAADDAEPYLDLLLRLSVTDPTSANAYAARFFSAAEMVVSTATASTVTQLAARIAAGDSATAGLVRARDDARRRLNAAESRAAELQAQNAYAGQAKADLDKELQSLQAELAAASAALLSANPRYDQLVVSDATLDQIQAALRPDEAYVRVLTLRDRGYGLLATKSSAKIYGIDLDRGAAAKLVDDLRAPLEATDALPPFDVARSHELFERLFGPVASDLLAARHLIYEPDGALVSLPAAVLVTDAASADLMRSRHKGLEAIDCRGVAWLGARLDSSLVLSGASFLQSRAFKPSAAGNVFLGFGDPTLARGGAQAFESVLKRGAELSPGINCEATRQALLELPSLPDTAEEVRSVAAAVGAPSGDVVLGEAFNDGAIRARKDLDQYHVLYFATHALLPMPNACLPQPALVMSAAGADSSGLLQASDILGLDLDADLIVLSACDTGGAGSEGADETGLQGGAGPLGGLARAAIYAGARGLIVSHWSIDSDSTVKLMVGLFQSGAPSLAEGLQRSQAALQGQARWSHPFYWAAFTVVGDGSRPIPGGSRS